MPAPLSLDSLAPVALWRAGDDGEFYDDAWQIASDAPYKALPAATYAALVAELRAARDDVSMMRGMRDQARKHTVEAEAELRAAREALAFYAEERTYVPQTVSDTEAWAIIDAPIHFDKGAKARLALTATVRP